MKQINFILWSGLFLACLLACTGSTVMANPEIGATEDPLGDLAAMADFLADDGLQVIAPALSGIFVTSD